MRRDEIVPGEDYAVRVVNQVIKATATASGSGSLVEMRRPAGFFGVRLTQVVGPWQFYRVEQDHEEAIAIDRQRDELISSSVVPNPKKYRALVKRVEALEALAMKPPAVR
jgi:hypothetical protein